MELTHLLDNDDDDINDDDNMDHKEPSDGAWRERGGEAKDHCGPTAAPTTVLQEETERNELVLLGRLRTCKAIFKMNCNFFF